MLRRVCRRVKNLLGGLFSHVFPIDSVFREGGSLESFAKDSIVENSIIPQRDTRTWQGKENNRSDGSSNCSQFQSGVKWVNEE